MTGWIKEVREAVNTRLRRGLDSERDRLSRLGVEAVELVDAVAELTLRGGKRLRPAVLYASYRAVRPQGSIEGVLEAAAGLELLQTYLLIHDDWMDGDVERRGGPSVHTRFAERHRDERLGASLGILAGNLACTFSWTFFRRAAAEHPGVLDAVTAMHEEVLIGQQLDLLGSEDVARMHQLKTGSYTLRGPMRIGALLGDAAPGQLAALDAVATPLGEAFQIRDDLLGTFGDPEKTGKPTGGDLRAGKRTSLVAMAEAKLEPEELTPLRAVLGQPAATEAELDSAVRLLVSRGVRAGLEARLDELLERAEKALDVDALGEPGTTMLSELATLLAHRPT